MALSYISEYDSDAEFPHTDGSRTDSPRTDSSRTDSSRTDSSRTDSSHTDSPRTDSSRTDSSHTDGSRMDSSRTDSSRTDGSRTDSSHTDSSRTDGSRTDSSPRTDSPRADSPRADAGNVRPAGAAQPEERPPFNPPDTPLRLMGEINRIMHNHIREHNENNNISQKSYRSLLIELSIKDGVTQLELVNRTHLKAPTISVTLQKMEREKLVIRRPDSYDMRATRVYLTEKGRTLVHEMFARIFEEEKMSTKDMTEEEIETLLTLLRRVRTNILEGDNADERGRRNYEEREEK